METQEKVICGQCKQEFASLEEEHNHVCSTTGFTPKDPQHYGEELQRVSQAALQRGEARKSLEGQGVDPEAAKEQTAEVGTIVQ